MIQFAETFLQALTAGLPIVMLAGPILALFGYLVHLTLAEELTRTWTSRRI